MEEFMIKEYANLEIISKDNRYYSIISSALGFICQEKGFKKENIDCKLILTENYKKDMSKYHFKGDQNVNPNGSFIPIYFQNDETKKSNRDIILVNIEKLEKKNASDFFIASVIVHEINHYLVDKEIYPSLKKKYNLHLEAENKEPILDHIGGLYQGYSEVYSKYYQEKYKISNNPRIFFDEYIKKWWEVFPKELDGQDYYLMCHIVGLIRCWEDFMKKNDSEIIVNRVKKYYFKKYEPIREYIYDIFDFEKFWNRCEKIYTGEIPTL